MATLRIWLAAFFVAGAWSNAAAQTIPPDPESYRPDEIKIGLQYAPWCGMCSHYTLNISGDGTVKYFGSQGPGILGSREDKISTEQVALLVNAFLRARFFELLNSYQNFEIVEFKGGKYQRWGRSIDHGLGVILSLELGERKKQIIVHYGYPAELGDLAALVDKVTQSARWPAAQ